MRGDFYRSRGGRRLLGAARKLVGNKRVLLTILGAVMLSGYILFDNKGILRRASLEMKKRELNEAIVRARQETRDLQAYLKAVEGDKKTIEKLAREKYGMAREGETVYRIRKD